MKSDLFCDLKLDAVLLSVLLSSGPGWGVDGQVFAVLKCFIPDFCDVPWDRHTGQACAVLEDSAPDFCDALRDGILVRPVQSWKAPFPISVTLSGMVTLAKPVQSAKV